MVLRLTLETPVERRPLADRPALSFELDFPAGSGSAAHADWLTRAGWRLAANRPDRMPGPVTLALHYEERAGRRDLAGLVQPVVDVLVKHGVIDGDHRSVLRSVTAGWGGEGASDVKGVRVTISRVTP